MIMGVLKCTPVWLGRDMGNPLLRTLFGEVELRPVAPAPDAPEGMQTYVLLPDLDELLGVPGFGLRDPIVVRADKPRATVLPSLLLH
jgi:hypothetical protein